MAGLYVPLVLVPRFTSYVGEGTYETAPLDVSEFARFSVTVWRGPRVGAGGSGGSFELVFEQSDDAQVWSSFTGVSAITTTDTSSIVATDLTMRWMRVKVTLVDDSNDAAAITCWVVGNLERRERGAA
jgi:hypothetical protein